jgi:hypothetical protein
MVKLLLKLVWLGFGVFGLVTLGQKYWPKSFSPDLIKGVQNGLVSSEPKAADEKLTVSDLRNLDPQIASQVLGTMVKTEVTKILEATSEEVKSFPAKQVKKIKIGACEEILEEDFCSVAKEIECPVE